MDDFLSIKIKKHTSTNTKLILATILQEKLIYDVPKLQKMFDTLKETIESNPESSLIIDCRRVKNVDPKIAWEGASLLVRLDPITKTNLKTNCMVMESKVLENLVNVILKVHKPIIPFKLVKNNQGALQFATQN